MTMTTTKPARDLAGALAGAALGAGFLCAGAPAAAADAQPEQLPTLSVREGADAAPPVGYKPEQSTLSKLTQPLRDTPQSVTVVTRQVLDDQAVTTLRDALRNVSGISLAAGEGGAQGDNLALRGFSARSDIYLDGMRDSGSYYRDPFDQDQVEVLKGASSMLFGRGSAGGIVNQVTKTPTATAAMSGTAAAGSDLTVRVTGDINQPLTADGSVAARLNVMGHRQDIAGRDVAQNRRYGVAPSLAWGLGTATRLTLSYFHQTEDNVSDYGIPFLWGRPAPVSRHSYYGFEDESFLKTSADIGTAVLQHDLGNGIQLRNSFRYAEYGRNALITEARIPTATAARPGSVDPAAIRVDRGQINVDSTETFLQDQADLTAHFNTGGLSHALVAGLEAGRETSSPVRYTWSGVPTAPLFSPNPDDPLAGTRVVNTAVRTVAHSVAAYAADTIRIGEQWELSGGLRWDRFQASYREAVKNLRLSRVDRQISGRGAVVYKLLPNASVYFSYGTSFSPSAEGLSLSATTVDLQPETSRTFEVGTKWDLLDEALSLSAALFRLDKNNVRVPDPVDSALTINGGKQRVDGFEMEASGRLADGWQVIAGYSFMDSTVLATTRPGERGLQLANTPKHTVRLWTTYALPWNVTVGGGATGVSSRIASTTADGAGLIRRVPGYFTFDAMVRYDLSRQVGVQLNLTNLTNRYYFDTIHPGHLIAGAGRTALVTVNFKL
jgi:catecholate siderophore receptor